MATFAQGLGGLGASLPVRRRASHRSTEYAAPHGPTIRYMDSSTLIWSRPNCAGITRLMYDTAIRNDSTDITRDQRPTVSSANTTSAAICVVQSAVGECK